MKMTTMIPYLISIALIIFLVWKIPYYNNQINSLKADTDSLRQKNIQLMVKVDSIENVLSDSLKSFQRQDSLWEIQNYNDSVEIAAYYKKQYEDLFQLEDQERVAFFLARTSKYITPVVRKVYDKYLVPLNNIDSANVIILKNEQYARTNRYLDNQVTQLKRRTTSLYILIEKHKSLSMTKDSIIVNDKQIIKNNKSMITELKTVIRKRDNRDRWLIIGGIALLIFGIAK